MVHEIEVRTASSRYPVLVGPRVRHELAAVIPPSARRAAIVTQDAIPWEVDAGIEQRRFVVGQGEQAKTPATVEDLCRRFARWGLTRADVVVAVGGGMVTDVGAFTASVYHRGVAVVHVATSLLGQVDAAVGGKSGVNLPEGKNLVGTFWQPHAVLCDTETLASLPPREHRSGLGEMAKYGFLGVEGLGGLDLVDAVAACVACKAAFVADDERETGRRALLNYGHTLAHALETVGGYDLRHGEAVGLGLRYAARLARRLGRVGDAVVSDHDGLLDGYELPSRLPAGLDGDAVLEVMARDKKATAGLTFVLDGPDGLEVVAGVAEEAARLTLEELRP